LKIKRYQIMTYKAFNKFYKRNFKTRIISQIFYYVFVMTFIIAFLLCYRTSYNDVNKNEDFTYSPMRLVTINGKVDIEKNKLKGIAKRADNVTSSPYYMKPNFPISSDNDKDDSYAIYPASLLNDSFLEDLNENEVYVFGPYIDTGEMIFANYSTSYIYKIKKQIYAPVQVAFLNDSDYERIVQLENIFNSNLLAEITKLNVKELNSTNSIGVTKDLARRFLGNINNLRDEEIIAKMNENQYSLVDGQNNVILESATFYLMDTNVCEKEETECSSLPRSLVQKSSKHTNYSTIRFKDFNSTQHFVDYLEDNKIEYSYYYRLQGGDESSIKYFIIAYFALDITLMVSLYLLLRREDIKKSSYLLNHNISSGLITKNHLIWSCIISLCILVFLNIALLIISNLFSILGKLFYTTGFDYLFANATILLHISLEIGFFVRGLKDEK